MNHLLPVISEQDARAWGIPRPVVSGLSFPAAVRS